MNEAAQAFAAYLDKEKITSFQCEEVKDELQSTVFRTSLILRGQSIPMGVIIDNSIYALVRAQIATRALTDENSDAIINLIIRLNNKTKPFKYYLTPDLSVVLDVCIPFAVGKFDPELAYRLVGATARELEANYREFVKLLWPDKDK